MRRDRRPGTWALTGTILAILFAAGAARAQTPIPTLPPLPPLPAAGESATPAAAPTAAPALPTPAPSAPDAATAATATISTTTATTTEAARPAPAKAPEKAPAADTIAGLPTSVVLLFGIGILVLVATLVVVLTVLLKKPVVINVPSRSAAPPPPPEPVEAPAAQDALPGRFVVDDGGQEVEIRIYRTAPGDRVETTIGRDPGPPYRHVQLNAPSVAGKHAKLVYDRGRWSLINYARTNPTRVNGDDLEENASRRLVDGDRIELGDVAVTFRED